jgi:hypothetical protein
MDRIQFQIKAQQDDEAHIERVFTSAAAQFQLVDTKVTSLVKYCICNYSEGLGFGFGLGSCGVGDLILIEFNPREGRTEKFTAVFDFIAAELRTHFGKRMLLADEKSYIAVRNTLPISDAARAFTKKIFESRHPKLVD